ncbi:metallophosphoesterase family protein [Zhaonella formicivorans]|uniref:metallophosphoesterase family protein n=1 Tax=Zhaonella formicivorans TaxID=2528593 RepID=UPI0010DF8544|nr:metallophosphoesterase family protein [Zhaonella formicivorans]
MLIGVLSDTHIPRRSKSLPPILWKGLEGVDLILHAGDINQPDLLDELGLIAPVHAVLGNTDPYELQIKLPLTKVLQLGRFKVGLVHGDGIGGRTVDRAAQAFQRPDLDIVIFGHSHQPYCAFHGKTLFFNPGSPTDKRIMPYYSYGLIRLEEEIKAELICF